jgi:type III secretion system YscQ/HrcQ family protein
MPESLRTLAICRQLARAVWNAPAAISHALEVHAVHWQPERLLDWPCQLSFSLTRRPEGTSLRGAILFESASALQWLHASLPIDAASGRARLALELPLRLVLGRSNITGDDLAGLDSGDVVWIESAGVTREGVAIELLAPLARRRWRCRAQRSTLRIVSAADDAEASAAEAPGGAHRTLEKGGRVMSVERSLLETPVTFDLGEINMKVQELERLQPGQIIDLPLEVSAATVALRVAGRRIAEGMLVAVGRRLGVRISRICVGPHAG